MQQTLRLMVVGLRPAAICRSMKKSISAECDFFRRLIADGSKENADIAQIMFWRTGLAEATLKVLLEVSCMSDPCWPPLHFGS